MPSVTREAATLFRLDRHHLNNRAKREHLAKVVSDICGVQAQLMSAAELSLWTRVDGLQREEIGDVLFNKHTLVKTWCMRGACHIIASADLPILVGGISRYGLQREKAWLSKRGISETEMDKTVKILVETLADETLTREELADRVAARIGSKAKRWIENSWGGIVKQACLQGLVVFGPNRGKNITFVRRTTWLPTVKDLPAKNAEEQLLLRYLSGYGPASLSDLAAWSGMTVGEAAAIKERVSDAVAEIDIEGKNCLIAKKDLGVLQKIKPEMQKEEKVRLLPSFDCFMLGYRDKSHLVDALHYKKVYRKAGWLSPVVLLNGKAVGVWSYRKKGKKLQVLIEPFCKLTADVKKELQAETETLANFYKVTPSILYKTEN